MSTKNPRINITFEESTVNLLSNLANLEHKSVAGLVRELTLEALAKREDLQLSRIAEQLDTKNAKTLSHEQAWR